MNQSLKKTSPSFGLGMWVGENIRTSFLLSLNASHILNLSSPTFHYPQVTNPSISCFHILFCEFTCVYVCEHACGGRWLSFYHVCHKDGTQVVQLGRKCLGPVRHCAGYRFLFLDTCCSNLLHNFPWENSTLWPLFHNWHLSSILHQSFCLHFNKNPQVPTCPPLTLSLEVPIWDKYNYHFFCATSPWTDVCST